MMPMFNRNHVDLAYDTTLMALRNTRHLAITQSHQYFVNFNPGGFPAGTISRISRPLWVALFRPCSRWAQLRCRPMSASR